MCDYTDRHLEVLKVVQSGVKRHGAKAVAATLGVSLGTVYADIDPNSIGRRTNKLGLLDWLVILDETQDLQSLDLINKMYNRISMPIPTPTEEQTQQSWMTMCATMAKGAGKAIAEAAESLLDGHIDAEELARCEKQTACALEAFGCFYLAIKKSREASL